MIAAEAIRGRNDRLDGANDDNGLNPKDYTPATRRPSREHRSRDEAERRLFARELHDEVGQLITCVKFGLSDLEAACVSPTAEFCDALGRCRALLEEMTESVRHVAMGLRPSILDDHGLGPAIQWQAREFSKRFDTPVTVHIEGAIEDCVDPLRIALLRIVQEALTNCARHAKATSVQIYLIQQMDCVTVVIQDNGSGLPPRRCFDGSGLTSIKERAAELGGSLTLSSGPGVGTKVTVRCPFPAQDARQ